MENAFEWGRVLLNDLPLEFLAEVLFRTTVMFLCLLVAIRLTGKRGVRQLSVFEIVIIVGLGSAVGDPMFYEDVGLLPTLVTFVTVIVLYRAVTWLVAKSKRFEHLVEGSPVCLIEDGRFALEDFKKESLAQDEFFMELRLKHVEHLGQVRQALIEINGEVSLFFYEDEQVKPGLPISPRLFGQRTSLLPEPGLYACSHCGHSTEITTATAECPRCHHDTWVKAIQTRRIS